MTPAALTRGRRLALAAVSLGVVVMVVFDAWYTLLAGVVLMLGAVVAGAFLVARPEGFLDHDAREVSRDGSGERPGEGPAEPSPGPAGPPGDRARELGHRGPEPPA